MASSRFALLLQTVTTQLTDATSREARLLLRLTFLLLGAVGITLNWWDLPLRPYLLIASIALGIYTLALMRLPHWVVFIVDYLLFMPLLNASGGTSSPLVPFPYIWLLGIAMMNQHYSKRLPIPAASAAVWLGVAVGSWGTPGWAAFMLTQSLALAITVLLLSTLMRERRVNELDPVAPILHRRAGIEHLKTWVKSDFTFSLAFLDCRDFKTINDQHGHAVGDEVIAAIARRLLGAVRGDDVVMRFGGDEFVVASKAPALTSRLQAALAEPIRTTAGLLRVGVDVGEIKRLPGESAEDVLRHADEAMYRQKKQQKLTHA